jgi:hypothetical protein
VFPRKRRHRMDRKKHSNELKARITLDAISVQKNKVYLEMILRGLK